MDAVSLLQTGSALLFNLGFCWLAGSWLARRWLAQGGAGPGGFGAALRKSDLIAAGLAIAGSAAALLAATAVMAGVGLREACPMVWMMLTSTDYGRAGGITLLAMSAVFALRLRSAGGGAEAAVLLALAVFAVTKASMGHAGENGYWTLPLAAEAVHFAAIAVWAGTVLVSGWLVLGEPRVGSLGTAATTSYLDLMSRAAMQAVIAIVVTGIYNGWHRVGAAEHLVHTGYGLTLLLKVALVLAAIAMGGYNKFVGLPAAARSVRGVAVVGTVLRLESVLLLGALAAAAVLTSQQPPAAL